MKVRSNEAAWRRTRGQCVEHARRPDGTLQACTYVVNDARNGACGPDRVVEAADNWLKQGGRVAAAFATQDAGLLPGVGLPPNASSDAEAWFEGNPHGYGRKRVLAVAEQLGVPIPVATGEMGRMRDLAEFLEVARGLLEVAR